MLVRCGDVVARVDAKSGAISFLSSDGKVYLREDEKRPCVLEEKPVMIHHFREDGFGNLRGKSREMYQHNLRAVVPVLVSTKGWGVLFDLGCLMAFHDDAHGSYLWADCADELDYYFLSGGFENVYRQYAALTGAAPLMPRYAFGFIQSKERYKDAKELFLKRWKSARVCAIIIWVLRV